MPPKIAKNDEEMELLGALLGKTVAPNSVVALFGDLGTGKTTFVKGLAVGAIGYNARDVNSPTFTYLNIYTGSLTLYHFDLYRLDGQEGFLSRGFDEYFHAGGICCIEWPEKILPLLPEKSVRIYLNYETQGTRSVTIL